MSWCVPASVLEPGISAGERLARKIEARLFTESFILRVVGDGLTDMQIIDGDLVRVDPTATPDNGDVTAILVDRERLQIGRFHRERTGRIRVDLDRRLFPRPFYYAASRVLVYGVAIGVYRVFDGHYGVADAPMPEPAKRGQS